MTEWFLIWFLVGSVLEGWLFKSVSGLLFWAGFILLTGGFLFLIPAVLKWATKRKCAAEICPHGVRGGATLLKCALCVRERTKREKQERELARIRREAEILRATEFARLAKLSTHKLDSLLELSPTQFEQVVAMMFRTEGNVAKVTSQSNDYGRDIILKKDGKTVFVECKRYGPEQLIGRPSLQKLHGAFVSMKADKAIFVTTSGFAATAQRYAKDNGIELIDGDALTQRMLAAFPSSQDDGIYKACCLQCGFIVQFSVASQDKAIRCPNGHTVTRDLPSTIAGLVSQSQAPVCEKCGTVMKRVRGRRGYFWGCRNYLHCRNTRPYLG